MICPDCFKAKISQYIKLEYDECPDCGGRYRKGKWISAPRFPNNASGYIALMDVRVSNAKKVNGVWRSRDAVKV